MYDQDVLACQKEIRRLRSVVRELEESEQILQSIIEYAKATLEESGSSLYGEEERPSDIYDCGYIDGEYNALVHILNMAKEKHDFQFQGE